MEIDPDLELEENKVNVDHTIVLMQLRYEYQSSYTFYSDKASVKEHMLAVIQQHNMAPYYAAACKCLGWEFNSEMFENMQKRNTAEEEALLKDVSDAKENMGESDVRDALQKVCDFYASIGNLTMCEEYSTECFDRTLGKSPKLDLLFQRIRLGLAACDLQLVRTKIDAAKEILKSHGDWERRNRLKVYEALYFVSVRKFSLASPLLLDSISTFSAHEVMEYKDFLLVAIIVSLVILDRPTLRKHITECSDIVAHFPELPACEEVLTALHNCNYRCIFSGLDALCHSVQRSVLLNPHVDYIYRELRIRAISQFLESYRSVTLSSMASAFFISEDAMEKQLCSFIASGRLHCKIDKLNGSVTATKKNPVTEYYRKIMEKGDALMHRVQKLSRAVGN